MQSDLWSSEIEENERAARFCVWANRGIGSGGFEELLSATGGEVHKIWDAGQFRDLDISEKLRARLKAVVGLDFISQWNAHRERLAPGVALLHRGDRDYPTRLLDLENPPIFLYVWGNVKALHIGRKIAIVGSRAANPEMCEFTDVLAAELSKNDISVISGGALGVDGCAHRGSLIVGGTTLAVLPGALDRPAPGRHSELFSSIASSGAVISEYPLGTSARPFHFARRNRLIAALSDAVVIIRAEPESGTMITAKAAEEIGRMVCAVPGALGDPFSAGCLHLLVHGARAVRNADDVIFQVYEQGFDDETHRSPRRKTPGLQKGTSKFAELAPAQVSLPLDLSGLALDRQQVLRALDELARANNEREVLVDELARHLGWNVVQLSGILVELELYQRVSKAVGTNAYRLVGR